MAEWEGWSTDEQQVNLTRVLAVLFGGLGADGQTRHATGDAVAELNLPEVDATDLAIRLVELGLFRSESLSQAPAQDTLLVTPQGRRVETEFRQASHRRIVGPPARRALLLWRYELDVHYPHSSDMRESPLSWFYGRRFSPETLAGAADNLVQRGYLDDIAPTIGRVGRRVELTALGDACVEKFGGDPDVMESAGAGQRISIGSYLQQGGNAALGSTVGAQLAAAAEPLLGNPATDLALILQMLQAAGDIPEHLDPAVAELEMALRAVATTDEDLPPLIDRSRQLLADLGLDEGTNRVAHELLTAAVNYAAARGTAAWRPRAVNR